MHKSSIDDSLSGTTAITLLQRGDVLYCANVGDSRAVMASMVDGVLKFRPLSSDQTPYRKDERARLKLKGAQIMTLDQIEGNEPIHENWGEETGESIDEAGDPPRVWDATLERPGCAFTRSIGDAVAERVGVFAEPELMTWKLSPQDKFVVIASDGVFEFLTSQAVVDMVSKFKNPLDAAKQIVAESYRLWLTYDDRTDDITIIIVTFDDFEIRDGGSFQNRSIERSMAQTKEVVTPAADNKPVRSVLSKAKRKIISESLSADDGADFDFAANFTAKSPEDLARINEMVSTNFMFQQLTSEQKTQIFNVMKEKKVKSGDVIIREGDEGDQLYIIDSGQFTVHKKDSSGVNQLVFTYTTVGAVFGELSLMYGKPRAASVTAKTDGRLWTIGRQAFRASIMKKKQVGLMKTFSCLPVFGMMLAPQLQRLCEGSTELSLYDNESLATDKDDVKWAVCVIISGSIRFKGKNGKKEKSRGDGGCIIANEFKTSLAEAMAAERSSVVLVPMELFIDVVGSADAMSLLNDLSSSVDRKLQQSVLHSFENKNISVPRSNYKLSMPVFMVNGDFGYVGIFKSSTGAMMSAKVIGKSKAHALNVASKLLNEKIFLSGLKSPYIASLAASCCDNKVSMLVYDDLYVGDLSMVLSAGIDAMMKKCYVACLVSAVESLHNAGLVHRFINTGSIYVTVEGVPKVII